MPSDKSHRGNASQFFVAGELCRRGYAALVTIGNTPNTDILCSNKAGTRFVHIQVKTFVPGTRTCSVGQKAEVNPGEKFFWILAGIPDAELFPSVRVFHHPSRGDGIPRSCPSPELAQGSRQVRSATQRQLGPGGGRRAWRAGLLLVSA